MAGDKKEAAKETANPNSGSSRGLELSVFLIFVTSIICFSSAADLCANSANCDEYSRLEYTIAAGVVSTVLTLLWLILRLLAKIEFSAIVELICAIIMVILWAVTAGVATSAEGPFSATGNGYFSTWAALLMSVLYFGHAYVQKCGNAHTEVHHHAITFIFAASIVELCVAIDVCSGGECTDREAFAVAVGAISVLGCILQLAIAHWGSHNFAQTHGTIWGVIFLVLWAFGAAFNTSVEGPFTLTCNSANGYFATWVAFAASAAFAFRIIVEKVPVEEA